MINKVNELLNNQMEMRNALALNIVEETKTALELLGAEDLLNTTKQTTKVVEKIVEIVKEVEVPVEIVKEVEVIKEIEVIKEVEVVREVEVIKEVEVVKEIKDLDALNEQLSAIEAKDKEIEALRKTIATWQSKCAKQENAYNSLLAKIDEKAQNTAKSQAKSYKVVDMPNELPEGLELIHRNTNYIMGKYNNIPFEASIAMEGTVIYCPEYWYMKEELNNVLVSAELIHANRDNKDIHRVECELGSCHEIDKDKYQGYVYIDKKAICYTFDKKYNNGKGFPVCVSARDRFTGSYKATANKDKAVINAINSLIDMHSAKVEEFMSNNNHVIEELVGFSASIIEDKKEEIVVDNTTTMGDLFGSAVEEAAISAVEKEEVKEEVEKIEEIKEEVIEEKVKTPTSEISILDMGWEDAYYM